MRIGIVWRAVALVGLVWTVVLGGRAWPYLTVAWGAADLPRADLLVDRAGCERPGPLHQRWTCEAGGLLRGDGLGGPRPGVYRYALIGDEVIVRHDVGTRLRVAVAGGPGDDLLLDATDPRAEARASLAWFVRQPQMSLGVVMALWLVLVAAAWKGPRADVLELVLWHGAPATGLAAVGVGVALLVGWWQELAVSGGAVWGLVLGAAGLAAMVRRVCRVDRRAATWQRGVAYGPVHRWRPAEPLGAVTELHLYPEGSFHARVPPGERWRLMLLAFGAPAVEIGVGAPARTQRLGTALASYLNVPLLDPLGAHIAGPPPVPPMRPDLAFDENDEDNEYDEDHEAAAGPHAADEWLRGDAAGGDATGPTETPRVRRRLTVRVGQRRMGQGVLLFLLVAAAASALFVVRAGGIDASAARVLAPDAATWVAAPTWRRAALRVVGARERHPETLLALVRLAHTLAPSEPLWPLVIEAAARVTGVPLPTDDPETALPLFDRVAADLLQRPLGPVGVFAWWTPDPFFDTWIAEMAGADVPLAIERFTGLLPPVGLSSERYLAEVGHALFDPRPLPFALVFVEADGTWTVRAVPPSTVDATTRPVGAATVGEALRAGLWAFPAYRPATPPPDVATWWTAEAARHGLPVPGV